MSFVQEQIESVRHRLPAQAPIKDFVHHNTLHAFQDLEFDQAVQEAAQFYREPKPHPVHSILFRTVANYLDQGISLWVFPGQELSFFKSVETLSKKSIFPLAEFVSKKRFNQWFEYDPETIIEKIIQENRLPDNYIRESLMDHPGWSGMVSYLEEHPESLLYKREIRLIEFLAFKMMLENEHGFKKADLDYPTQRPKPVSTQAIEEAYYTSVLSKIRDHISEESKNPIEIQALFCIDDRECSFRRNWENFEPGLETFGVAGFFGLDISFQSMNDCSAKKLCPPAVQPQLLVNERPLKSHHLAFSTQKVKQHQHALWSERLRNIFGYLSPIKKHIEVPTEIDLSHISTEEKVSRVYGLLSAIGLTQNFAPTVLVISHTSTSVNNPHFSAYNCGACSGGPGAPNARAFSKILNDPEIRRELLKKGISIPEETKFIPANHDTCTDEVNILDGYELDPKYLPGLEQAILANAKERCLGFELVSKDISPQKALKEVRKRSRALFEPRPELGHANNALCVVARRQLTKGLDLNRRAFLQSYDYRQDPEGVQLESVLSAVVPVCGGINLEYYFSKLEPGIYGCGTKLSHNVCSLIGVYNGIDDDLRTGLPVQMTELHEPIRILFVVEQRHQVVKRIVSTNQNLKRWVEGKWVKMVSLDPETRESTWI